MVLALKEFRAICPVSRSTVTRVYRRRRGGKPGASCMDLRRTNVPLHPCVDGGSEFMAASRRPCDGAPGIPLHVLAATTAVERFVEPPTDRLAPSSGTCYDGPRLVEHVAHGSPAQFFFLRTWSRGARLAEPPTSTSVLPVPNPIAFACPRSLTARLPVLANLTLLPVRNPVSLLLVPASGGRLPASPVEGFACPGLLCLSLHLPVRAATAFARSHCVCLSVTRPCHPCVCPPCVCLSGPT